MHENNRPKTFFWKLDSLYTNYNNNTDRHLNSFVWLGRLGFYSKDPLMMCCIPDSDDTRARIVSPFFKINHSKALELVVAVFHVRLTGERNRGWALTTKNKVQLFHQHHAVRLIHWHRTYIQLRLKSNAARKCVWSRRPAILALRSSHSGA